MFSSAPPQKQMLPCMKEQGKNFESLLVISPPDDIKDHGLRNAAPVVIPPKRGSRTPVRREIRSRTPSKYSASSRRSSCSESSNERPIRPSVASILDATTIPRRKGSVRRPRKLPQGNHVEEFSRMMQEGIRSKEDFLMGGAGNSPLDILLSPPGEDNDKYSSSIGNESELETPFSARSNSSDSVPSLAHDLNSPPCYQLPSTPGSQRSPLERRQLRYSPSEDCAYDHPLLEADIEEGELFDLQGYEEPMIPDLSVKQSSSVRSFPRLTSSFKSNLTASLRAIKSAAQSVSTFATPSVQPEDFLTRSLFTINPELTDDRRPPPMQTPPSPALRRYLNPTPMSPADMCVYLDHPHETAESARACPVSIQMQTYRRSRGRGHRRNNFHVISSKNRDHYYTSDPELPPMSRQREPRENSDFLRMVVLEMNMRRSGKLREDLPTRARIMLAPRKSNPYRVSGDYEDDDANDTVPSRWVGISA
jgi:hypothetical protein